VIPVEEYLQLKTKVSSNQNQGFSKTHSNHLSIEIDERKLGTMALIKMKLANLSINAVPRP